VEQSTDKSSVNARRALMTYAFVSHSMARSRDILVAIAPLFLPILRSFGEFPFDSNQFSERAFDFYGLNMNPMAVEELIPRLESLKLLRVRPKSLPWVAKLSQHKAD
jgi:hypothetical protein